MHAVERGHVLAAFAALGLLACGGEETAGAGVGDVADGEQVYAEPFDDGNTFACATCHALGEPADDGMRRPGHAIGDAAARPSYKNGQLDSLRDAVNSCVEEWMNGEPLAEDDPRWRGLRALLEETAGEDAAPAVETRIVDPPADPGGGNGARGHTLFNRSCAVCHGQDAVGTERGPGLSGNRLDAAQVATRVRRSGRADSAVYPGLTGGIMPFWSEDRLSDAELRDVVAYVVALGAEPAATGDAGADDDGAAAAGDDAGAATDAGSSGCAATHPLVGATGELMTLFHGVSGTARVVDDCTIVLEGFSYDGNGIDVQVYGGLGGDYDPPVGFSMSEDLFGRVFDEDTLTVHLPDDRTLDDLDGVSIWCVAVGANFGDARFQ